MTNYHEMAVALAEEVLASEQSKDYADARNALEENPENKEIEAEFLRMRADYLELVGSVIGTLQTTLGVIPTRTSCCSSGSGGCCGGKR